MKKFIPLVSLLALPAIVFAQELQEFQNLTSGIGSIVTALMPIAFTSVFVVFFWGVALYVVKAGDEEAQKKAKSIMIYGVIGIAIVASIWGIVGWLQSAFGVSGGASGNIPTFN